jgi:3-hydroxyacyl-CoA dehydrogenase/enoyl-CoA hydratase/3-hydroxybutyryl-CoA epimerase
MLKAGLLGRKAERGFYLYNSKSPESNNGLSLFQEGGTAQHLAQEQLQRRMVLLMVNEAARCLEEEIVAEAADVDFAMIMGTGFAPFRGGPLHYAESQGLARVADEMTRLSQSDGSRFQPCQLLQRLAAQGRKFYSEKGDRS